MFEKCLGYNLILLSSYQLFFDFLCLLIGLLTFNLCQADAQLSTQLLLPLHFSALIVIKWFREKSNRKNFEEILKCRIWEKLAMNQMKIPILLIK